MIDKNFNGNLRAAIDLLETTKENLETLWLGSEAGNERFGKIAH